MEGLERIEKSLHTIRDLIYVDKDIQKLLYYSSKDAQKRVYTANEPIADKIADKIFISPVFNTTKEPFNKPVFISITVANTEWNDETSSHLVGYRINIFSKLELWELDDERVRPLAIASKILQILDQKKLYSSHKLFYISSDLTVLNDDMAGYTLLFGTQDGGGDSDATLY